MELDPNPFRQFQLWLDEAAAADLSGRTEPYAMALATAGADGTPMARMVILRGFDARGLVFYTDRDSPKGQELTENPRAALVFYWALIGCQVRVAGPAGEVSSEHTERYFASRPRGAQLAAWIPQSRLIGDRGELEQRFQDIGAGYGEREVPRPPFWVGYRVRPESFEFWRSGADRLHDRLRYLRRPDGNWLVERLTP